MFKHADTRVFLTAKLTTLLMLVATVSLAQPVLAQFEAKPEQTKKADPADSLDVNARLAWNREWSIYASRYTKIGDEYYACAKYDPAFPSSSHQTAKTLIHRNSQSRTVRISGNMSRDITIKPNFADAHAVAPALPSLEFGAYGHVDSVQIVQITGPMEMIVRNIWLIDADQLQDQINKLKDKARNRRSNSRSDLEDEIENAYQFRTQLVDHQRQQRDLRSKGVLLMGFNTARLKADQRWQGPGGNGLDIAIAGPKTIMYTRSNSTRTRELEVVVALPVDQFKGRLSRDEFVEMLATRELTLQAFIDMTEEEKKADSDNAVYNTIRRVEEKRPKPAPEVDDKDKADAGSDDDKKTSVKRSSRSRRDVRDKTDKTDQSDKSNADSKSADDDTNEFGNDEFGNND